MIDGPCFRDDKGYPVLHPMVSVVVSETNFCPKCCEDGEKILQDFTYIKNSAIFASLLKMLTLNLLGERFRGTRTERLSS